MPKTKMDNHGDKCFWEGKNTNSIFSYIHDQTEPHCSHHLLKTVYDQPELKPIIASKSCLKTLQSFLLPVIPIDLP